MVIAAGVWSLAETGVGSASLLAGWEGAAKMIGGLLPPDLDPELLRQLGTAALETVQISIASLILGAAFGLPLAVLIAGNIEAPRWLSGLARLAATTLRSVHELLWALIFVATVGLGPTAGVYAIGLHSAGVIAKLCSEQLEAVDPAPVEAMRITGGSRVTCALLGVVPQARANIASQLLYQWECNIRSSVVVGFVGGGGIGEALGISLRLFRYQELATLLCAVLLIVAAVDQISRLIRARVGATTYAIPGTGRRSLLILGRRT
ncbi:phosphonate ABC transporter, permease protein PhnE [Actinomadura alba]|uniref:Phosphonate ABC transporter, permease protein PhnE n=1 Tax=Actinomadura alba TaxID=406431 RepID=A0ABR7LZI6_9ACTN|nr:phosphonate ABC transporter, permease protein PhnE [Actinomadura alba]